MSLIFSTLAGRIDRGRDHVLAVMERHAWCRTGATTDTTRIFWRHCCHYLRDLRPDLGPSVGPGLISTSRAAHGGIDAKHYKNFILRPETRRHFRSHFRLEPSKRPLARLFDCNATRLKMTNPVGDLAFKGMRTASSTRCESALRGGLVPGVNRHDSWQAYLSCRVEGFEAAHESTVGNLVSDLSRSQLDFAHCSGFAVAMP